MLIYGTIVATSMLSCRFIDRNNVHDFLSGGNLAFQYSPGLHFVFHDFFLIGGLGKTYPTFYCLCMT